MEGVAFIAPISKLPEGQIWNILAFIALLVSYQRAKFVGAAEFCNGSLMLTLYYFIDVYMQVSID
jgi:hypothetical protein